MFCLVEMRLLLKGYGTGRVHSAEGIFKSEYKEKVTVRLLLRNTIAESIGSGDAPYR